MLEQISSLESRLSRAVFPIRGHMPLGSWTLSVQAERTHYADTLLSHFKQRLRPEPPRGTVDARLYLMAGRDEEVRFTDAAAGMADQPASWERPEDGVVTLFTGWFRVVVFMHREPATVVLQIREPQYSREAFHGHLFEIMHKILFLFGRLYVHAGAVGWGDQARMFVGDRGSGKSTVCMRLAQEGAPILSDDHVVVRPGEGRFWVSGCEETGRVTEKTERELLARSLDEPVRDYHGMRKKEFRVADFFPCAHYRDFPLRQVFFTRVGEAFRLAPMPRKRAVLGLIETTRPFFRSGASTELSAYLAYCTELASTVDAYDLTLSPRLRDLDRLAAFLDEGCP